MTDLRRSGTISKYKRSQGEDCLCQSLSSRANAGRGHRGVSRLQICSRRKIVETTKMLISYFVLTSTLSEQHQRVMDQIAFIERVAAEPYFDTRRMVVALWELLEVTNQHFAHEEKAMVDDAFPGLALHCRDHEYLLKALQDYIAAFVDNTERPSQSFCDNLRSWIGFHCQRYDEDYSRFSDWRRTSGLGA